MDGLVEIDQGERQVATTLEGIRADHRRRYEFASRMLEARGCRSIIDAGCGVGYGSWILAQHGFDVLGVDKCPATIEFGRQHWGPSRFEVADVATIALGLKVDAIVAFEILEHLAHPYHALVRWGQLSELLIASVPNETCFPYRNYKFHYRHYTKEDFGDLLQSAGFQVEGWYGQEGTDSEVLTGQEGRTLVVVAKRVGLPAGELPQQKPVRSVSIVAMGASWKTYGSLASSFGGRQRVSDEVWAINNMGNVIAHDRLFVMDDLSIQRARAAANPEGAIAGMMEWLPTHPKPVYTPKLYDGFRQLVEFPLEAIINDIGYCYFNNTVAYAVAYAMYLQVEKIGLFGVDYSYANGHHAEKGRGNVEFLLGMAIGRGIRIVVPDNSTLLDANVPQDTHLYGYDTEVVELKPNEQGMMQVTRMPRKPEDIPTAEQIEARYDHTLPGTKEMP